MENKEYYYVRDRRLNRTLHGPVSLAELAALSKEGVTSRERAAYRIGDSRWRPCGELLDADGAPLADALRDAGELDVAIPPYGDLPFFTRILLFRILRLASLEIRGGIIFIENENGRRYINHMADMAASVLCDPKDHYVYDVYSRSMGKRAGGLGFVLDHRQVFSLQRRLRESLSPDLSRERRSRSTLPQPPLPRLNHKTASKHTPPVSGDIASIRFRLSFRRHAPYTRRRAGVSRSAAAH